ncbi:MAG: hypothetical protein H6548_12455 [Chitinophagales bacterium]|nr:hypothetical protein [Chitinophagales bacterium]MCB9022924.1 hypothetical protein [Chitinophagales bacterium]
MYRLLYVCCILLIVFSTSCNRTTVQELYSGPSFEPADQFFLARTWPDTLFPLEAYRMAMQLAAQDRDEHLSGTRGGGADWMEEGPYNISGRFNTIAIHPDNSEIILAGLASGGIFKTTDGGDTWYPVFDDFAYLAIAHILYDPVDPDIVWAATGDPNISGFPFIGDGVYKSLDGGETWTYSGLSEAGILSKVAIAASDHNTIYVGSMGIPFERNEDRGLYKSVDGGTTWTKVLFVDDDCGVIDIALHPADPDRIFVAVWNRIRNNHESLVAGPDAGVYRSLDGGDTWTKLTGGLPGGNLSRISVEMDPDNPETIYASVVDDSYSLEGIYKSENNGATWNDLPLVSGVSGVMSGFGWYFDGIQLNPFETNELFVLGVGLYRTTNDGTTWNDKGGSTHADKHAMAFAGASDYWLATDGGLYQTSSDASVWNDGEDINSAQFYHIDQNPHEPGVYWGGMQDNGTSRGSDLTGGLWEDIYGADGFHSEFRTDDEDKFYVEWQNGGIEAFNGFDFWDATEGISSSDRRNWNMPYMISRFDNDVLYAGTYRVYKSTVGYLPDYAPISGDLTDGNIFGSAFHTLTVIEEDRFDPLVLYTGSVDANVYRTLNGGATWNNVTGTLPEQYVTDLVASPSTPDRVWVTHSGYKEYDFLPHIHRSDDNGTTWTNVSGDLPPLAINAVAVHPENDDMLFVATDGGVYYTLNGGSSWNRLGNNMPVIAIYDIEYDAENNKVLAGSYARGLWTFDVASIIPPVISGLADTLVCAGDILTLTATGASTYFWTSDEAEIICAGTCETAEIIATTDATIEVIGTNDYGLSDTITFNITLLAIPEIPEVYLYEFEIDDYGCLEVIDPDLALTYTWWLVGEQIGTGVTVCADYGSPVILIAENAAGCTASTLQFIDWPHDIKDILSEVSIEPNPVADVLSIKWTGPAQPARYFITDHVGRQVIAFGMMEEHMELDTSQWPAGIYYLRADGWQGAIQIVKQ